MPLTDLIRARNYDAVIAALKENPALLEQLDEDRNRPLHVAAQEGDLAMVRLLIEQGADVNGEGLWFHTALFWAARAGNRDLCNFLKQRGATANFDVDVNTEMMITPLCEALLEGEVEKARLLLDLGASPDASGCSGNPLYLMFSWTKGLADLPGDTETILKADDERRKAHMNKMRDVARRVLERGADPNGAKTNPLIVDAVCCATNVEGLDFTQEIELLLDHGANIEATKNGAFGVDSCILMDSDEWFLDYEPNDVTALHAAAQFGNLSTARLLLARGANPNAETQEKDKPIHFVFFQHAFDLAATWQARKSLFEALVSHGADINARDGMGRTVLHCVVSAFRDTNLEISWRPIARAEYDALLIQVLALLAAHGADFTIQDYQGRTPQDLASLPTDSNPWFSTLWRTCSLRALGKPRVATRLNAIEAKIERLDTITVDEGLKKSDVQWLVKTAESQIEIAIRKAAATVLVGITQREYWLDGSCPAADVALRWVCNAFTHPNEQLRNIAVTVLGDWTNDYLTAVKTSDPSHEKNLPDLPRDGDWLEAVVDVLVKHHPKVAACLILRFGMRRETLIDAEWELLWEDEPFITLCRYCRTLDRDGVKLLLRLIEKVAQSLSEEEQSLRDFVTWPRDQALRQCVRGWVDIDLAYAVALMNRLSIDNQINGAVHDLLPVVEKLVAKGTISAKAAAKKLHPLLRVCASVVERSIESYAFEDNSPNYWHNTTIYDVAESVPPLWEVAATISSLNPANATSVWEQAIRLLDPYVSKPPNLCEYQVLTFCEQWDRLVKGTHPDPKVLFPLIDEKMIVVEEEVYETLLPHGLVLVLNQHEGEKLAQQVASRIEDEETPYDLESKEGQYVQVFLSLWAREDRDGFLSFARNWIAA